MIIKKLILHNFGIYEGTNEFVFDSNKKVVLIGGMNGRGKTTILEAVLLVLYGKNSFAYTESKLQSYSRYLDSYVNKYDKSNLVFIQLDFILDGVYYVVRRSWEGNKRKIMDRIEVLQEGVHNNFLTENWAMFMESLLPSGLSNFFFFDGEKIAELAADNADEKMKDSIKSLLGIEILDSLERNLNKLLKRSGKEHGTDFKEEVAFKLRKAKEDAEQELCDLDQKIHNLEEQLIAQEKKIEQSRIDYTTKGGDIFEKKEEYFKKRAELSVIQSKQQEQLLEAAASELPLLLVRNLLDDIRECSSKERDDKENKMALKKIREFYQLYQKDNLSKDLSDFIAYVTSKAENVDNQPVYNLSDSAWLQLIQLCDGKLNKKAEDTKRLFQKRDDTERELHSTESLLSVEIDEEKIGKIYKKIMRAAHKTGTGKALWKQGLFPVLFHDVIRLETFLILPESASSVQQAPRLRRPYTRAYCRRRFRQSGLPRCCCSRIQT